MPQRCVQSYLKDKLDNKTVTALLLYGLFPIDVLSVMCSGSLCYSTDSYPQGCRHVTQPACRLPSIDSPNTPSKPMRSRRDTPLYKHTACIFTFSKWTACKACTLANNNPPCQSRMDRHDRNESDATHFRNCYSVVFRVPKREDTLKCEVDR